MTKYSGGEGSMNQEQGPSEGISPFSLGNKGYFPETARKLPPTLPELPPMAKPPIEFPKRPETTSPPEPTSRKGLYTRLAGTLLIAIATAGPAIDHHVKNETAITPDAIGRDVASIPGFYWNLGKGAAEDVSRLFKRPEVVIPTTFDSKATGGYIGPQNSVVMTPEEYQKIAPPVAEKDSVNIPLFLRFPNGEIPAMQYKLSKGMTGGKRLINPIQTPTEMLTDGYVDVNDIMTISGIPIGTVLLSPIDGEIDFSHAINQEAPDGNLNRGVITITSKDSKGNVVYIDISTVRIKPIVESPLQTFITENGKTKRVPLPAVHIRAGDPIGQILTSSNDSFFPGQIRILTNSLIKEGDKTIRGGSVNISPVTTPQGKVIVLQ